jgi:hypothetical protein
VFAHLSRRGPHPRMAVHNAGARVAVGQNRPAARTTNSRRRTIPTPRLLPYTSQLCIHCRGPAVLRQRGLATALAQYPGFTDAGDLVLPVPVPVRGPSGLLAEDALVAMIGQVAEAVGAARGRGWFPLLLGGDCPVILGALAALQAERDCPGLLFVDGHEDA